MGEIAKLTGNTIATSVMVEVTLTSATQNPVTIATTGTITVTGTDASGIYGGYGERGTIINSGVLAGPNGYGIRLLAGGSVTNGGMGNTTASITGALYGMKRGVHGSGTVAAARGDGVAVLVGEGRCGGFTVIIHC